MSIRMHSVTGRVFVGEMAGLVFGLVFMFLMPTFGMPIGGMYSWGALLLFVMMGAMIGFIGVYERHPLLGIAMPWYVRGAAVGTAFALVLVLLNYNAVYTMMMSPLVSWTGLTSPFWILIDGAISGAIIGYICTKTAGEGSSLPLQ